MATTGDSGLKRDLIFITLGHGLFAIGQWAIGSAIAKLAGLEAMATFGLTLAIANPIYFLANMALRAALATDAARRFSFGDYWRARIAGAILAALAMAIAAAIVNPDRGFDGASALLLFALVKSSDCLFDVLYGVRQRDGSTKAIAVSLALRSVIGPAACITGLALSGGALWAGLAGWAIAAAFIFIGFEARVARKFLAGEPGKAGAGAVIATTWPLGIGAALAALETAIPRYVVDWQMDAHALGYFTGVFFFFQAMLFVANAFGSAASAHLGRAHAASDRGRFLKLAGMLALIGAGLGVAGILFALILGPWALKIVYTPDYAQYADVLTLTMAAAGLRFVASFLQFALVAARRFKSHMGLHLALAVVAALTAPPLIAAEGLTGAAMTLIVVGVVQVLILGVIMSRMTFGPPPND